MPYTVNSRALTGEKQCINKGFLVLLKHRKLTFNMIVPGPLKLFRHTLFNCHNTINWWCNRPIKMNPLKKRRRCSGRFWTLFFWVRVRYSIHHAREPLVMQRGTTASIPITTTLLLINYIINLCIRHRVVKQNWRQCCLHIFTMSKWE